MPLTYRTFTGSDDDFKQLAEIETRTIEDLREEEALWAPGQLRIRQFIFQECECIGAVVYYKPIGNYPEGLQTFSFTLLPAYHDNRFNDEILEHVMEIAKSKGATELGTNSPDSNTDLVKALERFNFEQSTSFVESELNLDTFDPSPLISKVNDVERQGIAIRSASDLEKVGIEWLRHYYDLQIIYIGEDEHSSPMHGDYQAYREEAMAGKGWFPPGQYAAFDGETCVGVTRLSRNDDSADRAWTNLTYVATTHRRKGIASALKIASLNSAKQAGIRCVETMNEGHIPMLQINYQLGFEKISALLGFKKLLA